MMRKINKILNLTFLSLFIVLGSFVATTARAQSSGTAELILSPASGNVEINRETAVEFKVKPNGRSVVGVDIRFEFIPDYIDIVSVTPANGFNKLDISSTPGMKKYSFTNLGAAITAETTIATLSLKGVVQNSSVDVLLSQGKIALSNGEALTLTNGGLTTAKGTYAVVAQAAPTFTPTPSPTPTPPPERPSIVTPQSGANFEIGTDVNSNRPEFKWEMMTNPSGSIKRMGVRVVKVADDPNSPINDSVMDCSDKVIVDRWWFSQAAADGQNPNSIASCKGAGQVSPVANNSDLIVEGRNFANLREHTFRPNVSLPPGKYFITVFNFDTAYRPDANTDFTGTDQTALTGFKSTRYFTVSCPSGTPDWDSTSKRCKPPHTASYAISENMDDLKVDTAIKWEDYNRNPKVISYTFANATPGQVRTIFIRFKDNKGIITPALDLPPLQKSIKYLGAGPVVSNISCGFNSETGTGSKVVITGANFGSSQGKGGVKILTSSGAASTSVASWGKVLIQPTREPGQGGPSLTVTPVLTGVPTTVPTTTGVPTIIPTVTGLPTLSPTTTVTPTGVLGEATEDNSSNPTGTPLTGTPAVATPTTIPLAQTQDRVVIKVKEKLEGAVNVELTLDDGRKIISTCAVDTNTVAFSTKSQCLTSGSTPAGGARIQIYEDVPGARPIYDSKTSPVAIGADGSPQWTAPTLEIGKIYNLVIKGPKALAVKKQFTVLEGTNILEDITFPVGDIAPLNSPDGVVNAVDKSELLREWTAATDVTRAGDFNMDSRINSLDYACMRENINKSAASFLKN